MARQAATDPEQPVNLEAKVAFLTTPDAYSDPTTRVRVVETHKSWVFLTDRFVHKLKKPIRYDSVDFRPLETRRVNCWEEVRLNRRLAGDVYIGAVPLTVESNGKLAINGAGRPVDWLVKMQRLPADLMLDRRILEGTLQPNDVERVATKLARFYQSALAVARDGARYRGWLFEDIGINQRDLATPVPGLLADEARFVHTAQLGFLDREPELFDRRFEAGRIVEGHGDLRPEHICLERDPVIFDCLEFDRRLRTLDAADELAFLSMQCDRLGAPFVGVILFDTYTTITGDAPPERLINFYKSYRAAVWARLAVWRALELAPDARGKWIGRANEYLQLARSYTGSLR